MKSNPANDIKDMMWGFLMDKGQKANIPALKECVYDLIQLTTQKTAGQDAYKKKDHIDFDELEMTMFSIVIEATALVLDGVLDDIAALDKDVLRDVISDHKLCYRQEKEIKKVIEVISRLPDIDERD